MMQSTTPPPGPPKRNLSETVWTKLDRKATAIAEFTIRQYRKKRSTWTVGAVGAILVVVVLLFYIDAMSEGIATSSTSMIRTDLSHRYKQTDLLMRIPMKANSLKKRCTDHSFSALASLDSSSSSESLSPSSSQPD